MMKKKLAMLAVTVFVIGLVQTFSVFAKDTSSVGTAQVKPPNTEQFSPLCIIDNEEINVN